MKKPLIPFRLMPGSWGLKGQAYAEAEANYLLEGEELDRRLADVRLADDPEALFIRHLDLDVKYHRKTVYERDRALAEREHPDDGKEREEALLNVDRNHGKLGENEYQKRLATLRGEPWVGIRDSGFDSRQGISGMFFELDWNDAWIDLLRMHGYVGTSDEQVIEQWFADISRSVVEQTPENGSLPLHRRSNIRPD